MESDHITTMQGLAEDLPHQERHRRISIRLPEDRQTHSRHQKSSRVGRPPTPQTTHIRRAGQHNPLLRQFLRRHVRKDRALRSVRRLRKGGRIHIRQMVRRQSGKSTMPIVGDVLTRLRHADVALLEDGSLPEGNRDPTPGNQTTVVPSHQPQEPIREVPRAGTRTTIRTNRPTRTNRRRNRLLRTFLLGKNARAASQSRDRPNGVQQPLHPQGCSAIGRRRRPRYERNPIPWPLEGFISPPLRSPGVCREAHPTESRPSSWLTPRLGGNLGADLGRD